jgi:hypothetical protein
MKSWSICAAAFALLIILSSVLRIGAGNDVYTPKGTVHHSPRLYLRTGYGPIGILEYSREQAANVRQYETQFCWGEHFFSLPFSAPVAASFVAVPAACIAVLLWTVDTKQRCKQ